LVAGCHVYSAAFLLPLQIPRSYESCNVYIRYEAEVYIDVPWEFDKNEVVTFFLSPRFDLNEFQHLREPVRSEAKKTFGFFCCESEPFYIFNILPRSGFVPGDRVLFTLELSNENDVSIQGATVELIEKIVYHAQNSHSKTRKVCRTLWKHVFSGFENQLEASLKNKFFSTNLYFDPAWEFCILTECRIITVKYYIRSEVRFSGCHLNLSNQTSITMGTIPFENYVVVVPSASTI